MKINKNKSNYNSMTPTPDFNLQQFYHGTKANLKQDDLIKPGFNSNYGKKRTASYVLKAMKEHLEQLKELGIDAIED